MEAFVVDASVAAGWFIPDEFNDLSTAVLRRLEAADAVVPDLFWHEMRSLLAMAARRHRITQQDALISMRRLRELNITTLSGQEDDAILDLANRHQLSAYDAAYLHAAIEQKLQLATSDKQLLAAAPKENVILVSI